MSDREIERRLRGLRRHAVPPGLEARLMEGIPPMHRQGRDGGSTGRWWMVARVGMAMGVAAGLVWGASSLFGPRAVESSWAETLESVASASGETGAVRIVERVRTKPGEDFEFVEPHGDLIQVEAWVRWPRGNGDRGRARVEKPGLIYTYDGQEAVSYFPDRPEAYRAPAERFRMELFWPEAWLRHLAVLPNKDVEVAANEEANGAGRLVLRWKGPEVAGREPSFFSEFDREIEVTWDSTTRRLTGFNRWVLFHGERVLLSELVTVDYPGDFPEETFQQRVPPDVPWGKLADAPESLNALGPREVADLFWRSAIGGDWETVAVFCASPATMAWLQKNRPVELLELGEPLRTGGYGGVYVPYKVRYAGSGAEGGGVPSPAGGVIREHRMALRNDNEFKRWVEDGGI